MHFLSGKSSQREKFTELFNQAMSFSDTRSKHDKSSQDFKLNGKDGLAGVNALKPVDNSSQLRELCNSTEAGKGDNRPSVISQPPNPTQLIDVNSEEGKQKLVKVLTELKVLMNKGQESAEADPEPQIKLEKSKEISQWSHN